jgi:hypothetical protein
MQWMTRSHLHLDRMATSWLILRFIDADAQFLFIDWEQEPAGVDGGNGPIPFGMPGVALSSHDEHGTAFAKTLRAYRLDDPALALLARIVDAGVRHALAHDQADDATEEETIIGAALDMLGEGFGVAFEDEEHIDRVACLYDGLYALCQVRTLPSDMAAATPRGGLPERIGYLRGAIGRSYTDRKVS